MPDSARIGRESAVLNHRWYFAIISVAIAGVLAFSVLAIELTPTGSPNYEHVVLFWGSPANLTGTTPPGCPSAAGHYCYTIGIDEAAGMNTSNVGLALRNGAGAEVPWPSPPLNDTVQLLCPGFPGACAQYSTSNEVWQTYESFSGALASGETVVIYTSGIGPAYSLRGNSLIEFGTNGNPASAASAPFP